jgi:hypothetical protein
MSVQPQTGAPLGECFPNVQSHIAEYGGDISYGWYVETFENVYAIAEFHAVWCDPNDDLVDITPKPGGEATILFQPVVIDKFDYLDPTQREKFTNRYVSFVDDPLVDRFIELYKKRDAMIVKEKPHTPITFDKEFFRQLLLAELEVIKKYKGLTEEQDVTYAALTSPQRVAKGSAGRNDPCPCGSGKKHKKCCGA